ncbi:PREDICTED: uncharacterized protein LOC108551820 [Eufriesea mexicana]|uniref:uncharacterized protein LOC108551820 n=1 Tax=Eufriesea mexicana TaxID=516756 RepID=UPI00083BD78F|nr:PREDICTED: uncharacterized protein LOC108551820 [Eufriesea mexicana]
MLSSKATAALMRLKEMDRKYNIKCSEGKRVQSNVSTESSLEGSLRDLQVKPKVLSNKDSSEDSPTLSVDTAEKEIKSKVFSKSKMEIKIPINSENDKSVISDSTTLKKSPEAFITTKFITEDVINNEMEEESDTSKTKESLKDTLNSKSISKIKIKVPMLGFEDPLRDNDDSTAATVLSRHSDISEIISEAEKSVNEFSSRRSDGKSNIPEVTVIEDSVLVSNNGNNETTIEEIIKISEERSEIISELSDTMDKDVSVEKVCNGEDRKTQYEDDTFEEVSSSIESSSSVEERQKNISDEDTVISGVKQIKIIPHKQIQNIQKTMIDEGRDKEIVELIAPKIMQSTSECNIDLDEELSNYVKTTENADEAVPISLLKLPKQIMSTKKHIRKNKKHKKSLNESTEEKTDSTVVSEHERLTDRKENTMEKNVVGEQEFLTSTKSEKKIQETSLLNEQDREECINKIEGGWSRSEVENDNLETTYSEEKFFRETPKQSNVISTLRKLNKDAINAIVRRNRVQTTRVAPNKSRHCKNCGTIVKIPPANAGRNTENDDSDASSAQNVKMFKDSNHDQKLKRKKVKNKKVSRTTKSRKLSNCNKVEGKYSRSDCRQTHCLRKQTAIFRLQQEREDIRNYLLQLERTRLGFSPGESNATSQLSVFRPLEFPKIEAFVKPDLEDIKFKAKDEIAELQEKILMIRQWLKDQYILYRDYSSLAQTVNSKYIPANLEDAKKMIRQLQRATIKSR